LKADERNQYAQTRSFPEMDDGWLRERFGTMTNIQLTDEYNRVHGTSHSRTTIGDYLVWRLGLRKASSHIEWDDDWLRENWRSYQNTTEAAEAYNREHGTEHKCDTIRQHAGKLGLAKFKNRNQPFTEAEDEWIRKNYPYLTERQIETEWLLAFGKHRDSQSIRLRAWYLGVPKDEAVSIQSRIQSQEFPKGSTIVNQGYVLVNTGHQESRGKRWQMLSRVNWEKAHGKIPPGHVIIYRDGNTLNCNPENLACIPKHWLGYLATVNRNGNELVTDAALKYCELRDAIRDAERGNNNA